MQTRPSLRTTPSIVGPGAVILGLVILVIPPDKIVDIQEADVPLQFYLGDVDGGDAVSALYMVVLVLWLAKIFEHDLLALQQRWLPKLGIVQKVLSLLTPVHRGLKH